MANTFEERQDALKRLRAEREGMKKGVDFTSSSDITTDITTMTSDVDVTQSRMNRLKALKDERNTMYGVNEQQTQPTVQPTQYDVLPSQELPKTPIYTSPNVTQEVQGITSEPTPQAIPQSIPSYIRPSRTEREQGITQIQPTVQPQPIEDTFTRVKGDVIEPLSTQKILSGTGELREPTFEERTRDMAQSRKEKDIKIGQSLAYGLGKGLGAETIASVSERFATGFDAPVKHVDSARIQNVFMGESPSRQLTKEEQVSSKIGEIIGTLIKYKGAGAIGESVAGTKFFQKTMGKLSNPFAKKFIEETSKDLVSGIPLEFADTAMGAFGEGQSIGESIKNKLKQLPMDILLDTTFNLAFISAGSIFDKGTIEEITNQPLSKLGELHENTTGEKVSDTIIKLFGDNERELKYMGFDKRAINKLDELAESAQPMIKELNRITNFVGKYRTNLQQLGYNIDELSLSDFLNDSTLRDIANIDEDAVLNIFKKISNINNDLKYENRIKNKVRYQPQIMVEGLDSITPMVVLPTGKDVITKTATNIKFPTKKIISSEVDINAIDDAMIHFIQTQSANSVSKNMDISGINNSIDNMLNNFDFVDESLRVDMIKKLTKSLTENKTYSVYHKLGDTFDPTKVNDISQFSNTLKGKEGTLDMYQVKLDNPLLINEKGIKGYTNPKTLNIDDLKQQGHDGIIDMNNGNIIPFNKKQFDYIGKIQPKELPSTTIIKEVNGKVKSSTTVPNSEVGVAKKDVFISPEMDTVNHDKLRQFSVLMDREKITMASDVKDLLQESQARFYTPTTDALRTTQAEQLVEKNLEAVKSYLMSSKKVESPLDPFLVRSVALRLDNMGRTDEAIQLWENASSKATFAGQTLQGFNIFTKGTPESMIRRMKNTEKVLNDVVDKSNRRALNNVVKNIETLKAKGKSSGKGIDLSKIEVDNGKVKFTKEFKDEIFTRMQEVQKMEIPDANKVNDMARQITDMKYRLQNTQDPKAQDLLRRAIDKSNLEFDDLQQVNTQLQRMKDIEVAKILRDIGNQIPSTMSKKLNTFQTMAQLINPATAMRNVLGNAVFMPLESASKVVGKGFDLGIERALTQQKSIDISGSLEDRLKIMKKGHEYGMLGAKEKAQEIKLGIELGQVNKYYDTQHGFTFKNPFLQKIEKTLGYELQVPDEYFKGSIYSNTEQELKKVFGKDAINYDEMIREMSEQQANYATFQDNSATAQFLVSAKNTLNIFGVGKTKMVGNVKVHEFGAGDFVVKYARVPGNIISRGFEYSPMGYIKAISNLNKLKNGFKLSTLSKAELIKLQRETSIAFGRATSGSGLMILGSYLHQNGVIIGDNYSNPKEKALNALEGKSGYKINISALNRMVTGEDMSIQDGDNLIDMKFMEIWRQALTVGASLDSLSNTKKVDRNIAKSVANATMDELLDMPMLYTIKSMVYAGQGEDAGALDVLSVPLDNALSSFSPSILRQIAQADDNIKRNTRGLNVIDYISKHGLFNGVANLGELTAVRKVQANIPFARKQLEPKISGFGEVIQQPSGTAIDLSQQQNIRESSLSPQQQLIFRKETQTPEQVNRLAEGGVSRGELIGLDKLGRTTTDSTELTSKTQIPSTGAMALDVDDKGNVKSLSMDIGEVLLPAKVTKYHPSAMGNFLRTLQQKTGDSSMYPDTRTQQKITDNQGIDIPLTDRQKTQYQQYKGQFIKNNYDRILTAINHSYGSVDDLSPEYANAFINELNKVKTYSNEFARKQVLKDMGIFN